MAITIDYGNTFVIFVPQADLTLVSGTIYELDVGAFRLTLKDIEDGLDGMVFPDTHVHNTEVTIAGTTFARGVEILPPYSVEFEDGQYTVRLVGANNNIFDVEAGILVQNQVQVIPTNSAGLTSPGFTAEQKAWLKDVWQMHGLEPGNPMTVTPSSRQTQNGDINQAITGDGETTSTVTRQ